MDYITSFPKEIFQPFMTVCTSIHDMMITSKLFFKKCYEMLTNSWDKVYGLNTAFKFMNM